MRTLLAFALASFVLVVIPGPNVVYIVTRGVAHGRGAAVASTLGVEAGMLVHIAAAAAGVSALVTQTALTFTIVKVVGAVYLLWLAVSAVRHPARDAAAVDAPNVRSRGRLFAHGFAISALNPKVAVFFLAFLPQFIEPSRGGILMQTIILGTLFLLIATVVDLSYGLLSGFIGTRIARRGTQRRVGYLQAVVYTGLAVAVATTAAEPPDG